MAQKILIRRGGIGNISSTIAVTQGELLYATGSTGGVENVVFVSNATSNNTFVPIGQLYTGTADPANFSDRLDGLPYYKTDSKALFRIGSGTALDLTGNIESRTISGVTITNLSGTNANFSGNITGSNLLLSGNANIDGNIILGGNITIGDANTDNISLGGEFTSNLVPNADNTYSLGTSARRWQVYGVNSSITGSFTGSFVGDGSGLTGITATTLDIDNFGTDLTAITIADSDKLILSDAGTEGRITASQIATYVFNKASDAGDASIGSNGSITINSSAVEGTMLNSNVADGTTLTLSSNTLSVLKVPNALTAGAGLISAGTFDGASARTFSVNSGSMLPYYSGSIFGTVSGDITISSAGVATIANDAVELGVNTTGNYMVNVSPGTLIDVTHTPGEGSTATINVDLTEAAEANIANGDYILFLDGGATGTHAKEAIADVATLFAGTGLTATNSVIAVDYGSTSGTAVQGNTNITITGTTNEVEITGTSAQALGGGPSYQIGLPNNVTVSNNLTVGGNLIVNGTTTTVNSTEVNVGDRIITLNTAGTAADGGIQVIDPVSTIGTGSMLWNSTSDYWYAGVSGSTHYRLATYDSATPTTNALTKVDSNKRLVASNISDSGTAVTISTGLTAAGFTDSSSTAAIRFTYINSSKVLSYITPTTAGDLIQWNGSAMVANNVIDGGTF